MSGPGVAHEFWLEPSDYQPARSRKLTITHRNGQFFKGNSYPYLREWFDRFELWDARGRRAVKGVDGDDPAARIGPLTAGVTVVAYQSRNDSVTFKTWKEFRSYLADEGLEHIEAQHVALKLPLAGIAEHYIRCAKTLIRVDGAPLADRHFGMPVELLVERVELVSGDDAKVEVRLLHDGKPAREALVKVFRGKAPRDVLRLRTNGEGRVVVRLARADTYLLNAVVMRPPKAGMKEHWLSLWASTTFSLK
ncbi:MAG: DUF4198 domain-containing protein [Hyphomicrobiaceae bacterium]|nr:DUF4198 domain-containing protein [Hyphomicrobiaceae bacterium]